MRNEIALSMGPRDRSASRARGPAHFTEHRAGATHSSKGVTMRAIGKVALNQRKHPYVVELEAAYGGLDVKLSRQIVLFHQSRHVQPQYGRTIVSQRGLIGRWCFNDLSIAHGFIEQFGGRFRKARI
jgi:hypothetical protein